MMNDSYVLEAIRRFRANMCTFAEVVGRDIYELRAQHDELSKMVIAEMTARTNCNTGATENQQDGAAPKTKVVKIPACEQHEGIDAMHVVLAWNCPVCGGPRGEPVESISYDGSRRLACDGWRNPCGHVDKYSAVRAEAVGNGLNKAE